MTFDTVIGIVITLIALATVVFLTQWSRKIIDRINAQSPCSLRDIQKDIINGDKS